MSKDNIFIKLLKKHTDIDRKFINTFFKKFKIGGELDFDIEDTKVANYLDIELITLRKRLLSHYSKTQQFIENVDFIKMKGTKTSEVKYMINYQCFERIAMRGDSKKCESIRMYFIKLREFIMENQRLIYQAIENIRDANYSDIESIYFFAIDERHPDTFKIGRTKDIVKRLNNYNVGRIKEVDLKYFAIVTNSFLIENCMKLKLKKNQIIENKEIYEIDPKMLKKIINDCYCKYVSHSKNESLYQEIADLLGLYAYTKDKVNIKPFVILDK